MPDSGSASTNSATPGTLLPALAPGSAMQASSRFSAPVTTTTPLLKTKRTVLLRPLFPVQPPSSLSLSMPPYQPADVAAKPPPRARTTGPDDGEGKRFRQSRRAPAVDAGDAPEARLVRCCSTTESEPPDGMHGNGLTTGVSQQEPYDGKGNDSGKSAAHRRNPALLRSHRHQATRRIRTCGLSHGLSRDLRIDAGCDAQAGVAANPTKDHLLLAGCHRSWPERLRRGSVELCSSKQSEMDHDRLSLESLLSHIVRSSG